MARFNKKPRKKVYHNRYSTVIVIPKRKTKKFSRRGGRKW